MQLPLPPFRGAAAGLYFLQRKTWRQVADIVLGEGLEATARQHRTDHRATRTVCPHSSAARCPPIHLLIFVPKVLPASPFLRPMLQPASSQRARSQEHIQERH